MMSRYYNNLHEWVGLRNNRERILILIAGCAIIYMFWFFLVSRPLLQSEKLLQNKIVTLKDQIKAIQDQSKSIIAIAKEYSTNQQLQIQKALLSESESLKKTIESSATRVSSEKNIERVLKDILSHPQKGVLLVDLRSLELEPLIPAGLNMTHLPHMIKYIYKQGINIHIQSDFFNTINYLNQLEKLSWHLYWDSITYRVMDYPKADVTIKIYVLVNQLG